MRLRAVDQVVATLDAALAKKGETLEALERWKAEMPTEAEMLPRDKYTMFDRKVKGYRKGIHSTLFSPLFSSFLELYTKAQLCGRFGMAWKTRDQGRKRLANLSVICRATEVDEGFSASQPPRLLSWTDARSCTQWRRGAFQGGSRGTKVLSTARRARWEEEYDTITIHCESGKQLSGIHISAGPCTICLLYV